MALASWLTGQDGTWETAGDWSTGTIPGAADTVSIITAANLPYAITVDIPESVNILTLNQVKATLDIAQSTLTVGTGLTLTAGTLALTGGTLLGASGTTAVNAAAGITVLLHSAQNAPSNDTISSIAWRGAMNVVGSPNSGFGRGGILTLNAVTFAGTSGNGAGTLSIGNNVTVAVQNNPSLFNVDVTLGSGATLTGGGSLTIAGNTVVADTAGYASIQTTELDNYGQITASGINTSLNFTNGGSLTNYGTLAVSSGATASLFMTSITNTGMLEASSGATLLLAASTINNSGSISAGTGSFVELGNGGSISSLTSTGAISVAGGTLALDYALTTAQAAAFAVTSGTLGIAGTLTNTGSTLTTGSGTNTTAQNLLLDGGTILGGTIVNSGGFSFQSAANQIGDAGTLTGVAFDGKLSLDNAQLTLNGGTTLAGTTAGSGAALALTGGAAITFVGSQELDHATITFGGNGTGSQISAGTYNESGNTTLTLGPNTTLTETGSQAALQTASTNDTLINEGSIQAAIAGANLYAYGLINAGQIALSNNATLTGIASNTGTITAGAGAVINGGNYPNPGDAFINTGLITEAQSGATLQFGGVLDNAGTITVSNGATLSITDNQFGSSFANTGVVSVTNGVLEAAGLLASQLEAIRLVSSQVIVTGYLTIDGSPLRLGTGTALPTVKLSGTLSGGTIIDSGNGLALYGAVSFDNITYQGTLNINRPLTTLTVNDAFAARSGATGTAPGIINLVGAGSTLNWTSTQTFDNATLSIGNAGLSYAGHAVAAPAFLASDFTNTATQLGAYLIIRQAGTYADVGGALVDAGLTSNTAVYSSAAGTIVSAATLMAGLSKGQLSIEGAAFTNTGTIAISNTDTVTEGAASFTNTGLITISTGGALNLDLYNYFATNSTANQSFTNAGTIVLTGGRFTELTGGYTFPPVPVLNTGKLQGSGAITSQILNTGTISATGGTLTLVQSVVGAGTLVIGTGATLSLAAVGGLEKANFGGAGGVLALTPASFLGKIGTFTKGDTIDLVKTAASGAAFSGTSIVVTLATGSTIKLATVSALTGSLTAITDGHGGTLIQFAAPPAHGILPLADFQPATLAAAAPADTAPAPDHGAWFHDDHSATNQASLLSHSQHAL